MAELSTLARPYATATFKLAKETNAVAAWSDTLKGLAVLTQNGELMAIVTNPRLSKETVSGLLFDICGEQLDAEAGNLLKLLMANGKLSLLPAISRLYEEQRAEDEGYVNVELYSAFPLTATEESKYAAMLEKQLQKKVKPVVSVDSSLLGGILAKAGDKVLDGSIRGQIHQLAKKL